MSYTLAPERPRPMKHPAVMMELFTSIRLPRPPRFYLRRDGDWPRGPFVADAPCQVRYATTIAVNLVAILATRGWSLSQLAKRSGVNARHLRGAVTGRRWPDVPLIADVEAATGEVVWPRQRPEFELDVRPDD